MEQSAYFTLSILIFVAVYAFIIWDKFDRAVIALSGAVLMILIGILTQEKAFLSIDYNTITLLISMMIIVMITKRTGIFEYLAIKIVKISKAEPFLLIILLSIVTGIVSSLLDNVTTILLILPVTLNVAKDLRINSIPFIIAEVFASNVGGTATLIGDPPNIMIGSKAGLDFIDFVANDAVIAIPILIITSLCFALIYKKQLVASDDVKSMILSMNEKDYLKDVKLLRQSLGVLILVVIAFLFHSIHHLESGVIALAGAVLLLFLSGLDSEEILREVEWKTIAFFIGLFILVGAIDSVGAIHMMANEVIRVTGGNLFFAAIAILWVSAIASAFIDNIPFVATMIPLILQLGDAGMNIYPLWWALSLGACLGGNGTIVGASANVIAVGMAEQYGYKITFGSYFKIAFPMMLLTIAISTVYLIVAYFI